jgi:flagellar biosynthesis chaperone FliJ
LQIVINKFNALQGNIDKIKGQGAQAKAQVKELIKSANDRQQSTLNKLKASITAMSDTAALESQLNLLKKDIDSIAGAIDTAGAAVGNPAADAAAKAASSCRHTWNICSSSNERHNCRRIHLW